MPSELTVEDIFSLLSERLDGYESRSQQLQLSNLIHRCFTGDERGIFEAGTGTGKSLAALIPAVLSGKKVVVSTATIALQEQYINKDIPLLQSVLPFDIQALLMKGRGNYLSMRRFEDHVRQSDVDERVIDWANSTAFGDVSELDFVPQFDTWMEVNSDSDDCLRNKCPHFNECFYFESRKRAEKADILVVNHALLLADAASGGNILPPYQYLIVDEAQHLPDIATDAFSSGITNRGLKSLASKAANKVSAPSQMVRDIEMEGFEFFERLRESITQVRMRIRQPIEGAQYLHRVLSVLKDWLEAQDFSQVLDVDMAREKMKLKAKSLITQLNGYLHCLDLLIEPDREWVVWAERGDAAGGRTEVIGAPLDVSAMLRKMLLERPGIESVVMMSATLATAGADPFAFFKRQIGSPADVIQAKIDSPFDYARQAVLYLPTHLPEPNAPDYIARAADEIDKLVRLSYGRAFVLFTSYYAMNSAYTMLKERLPFESKRQGEMPRKRLIEWYRSTPAAVLFGTSSFWEGVSIDGDQLSLVIIDRVPFQVPDDPVYEARREAMELAGEGRWFNDLALPYAIMRLKQGVGRLIRTRSDRGMVAILDPRLTNKKYGRMILESLPPMRMVKNLKDIEFADEIFN